MEIKTRCKGEWAVLSAVILAAGESKRMGGYTKALLPVDGGTFLERTIELMHHGEIGEIFIILGPEAEEVKKSVQPGGVRFFINKEWKSGQLSSLRIGVRHLSSESEGMIFTPVDHPLVQKSTYDSLISFWLDHRERIVVPVYRGRKGHPALFPRGIYGMLLSAELPGGARDILYREKESVSYVEVADFGVVQDIDTVEDYRRYIGELP
jgi:molybdenum cofactor cytidylyltransferase